MNHTLFTLPNGLRVVHHLDQHARMAAVNILYNVGARDDEDSLTGMAHLHEHLMFGGSVNVSDFDGHLEHAGGKNNAWTSDDFTCFWDYLPVQNIETAFWLESDRMLGLDFSERTLEVQRNVVTEEFKQVCINRPYGMLGHRLRQMLYTRHPYRHPAIGLTLDHIQAITLDDVKRFFFSHYAPDNAVFSVAGNITAQEVERLALKWFGSIPVRNITPRKSIAEPQPLAPVRLVHNASEPQTAITTAFPMSGYGTRQYFAADFLTDILASGKASRFNRRLLQGTSLFTSVDASISGHEEPGYLLVKAMLRSDSPDSIDAAEKAIREELDRAADMLPTAEEMQRALNRFESNLTFGEINCLAKADRLAMEVMHGETPGQTLDTYRSLTASDIREAAREITAPHRARTLIYRHAE